MSRIIPCALPLIVCSTLAALAQASETSATAKHDSAQYSPYLNQDFAQDVYFGDTHLHSSYSADAGLVGNRLGPEEAYRFAMGEEVTSSTGVKARLQKPLDFLVVSDHSDNLGLVPMLAESNPSILKTAMGKEMHDLFAAGKGIEAYGVWMKRLTNGGKPTAEENALSHSMWQRLTKAAEQYNQPGRFTALIGFEWTATPNGNNLHRNVIFRGNKAQADLITPYTQYDSVDPEDLWQWMANAEQTTGSRLLAIPHNGNLSNGLMFDDITLTSQKPIDRAYAEQRMRWEPLYEVTQIKGDGEAHPSLSPNDEFANFETWDKGSFGVQAKTADMLPKEYAREALKRGLQQQKALGSNPFKFGMIGSSDSHTSLSTTAEDNFFGKVTPLEPSNDPLRFAEPITGRPSPDPALKNYAWQTSASGLAAVWAKENSREALWDGMAKKEVYATSGTRIKLRIFAGYDFAQVDPVRPDFARYGYQHGVPMGGDLAPAKQGQTPRLIIQAQRDADGANLDRVQVIKGWQDNQGTLHEQVYDVAWSGQRQADAKTGKVPAVGNTVNGPEASYDNSIGAPELFGYWQDPSFNAEEGAFYYVRVLEIPTPRWTTYDAKFFQRKLPEGAPIAIQERAYSSPIWYNAQ